MNEVIYKGVNIIKIHHVNIIVIGNNIILIGKSMRFSVDTHISSIIFLQLKCLDTSFFDFFDSFDSVYFE